jgi:hypothetical protein
VKETFLSILCGVYHFRVKYPEQEDEPAEGETPAPDRAVTIDRGAGLDVQIPEGSVDPQPVAPDGEDPSRENASMG